VRWARLRSRFLRVPGHITAPDIGLVHSVSAKAIGFAFESTTIEWLVILASPCGFIQMCWGPGPPSKMRKYVRWRVSPTHAKAKRKHLPRLLRRHGPGSYTGLVRFVF
jgi:hypothetical protein